MALGLSAGRDIHFKSTMQTTETASSSQLTRVEGNSVSGNTVYIQAGDKATKLEGYLLDPAHPQNQTKATWFQQALGFDKSDWQQLGSQITFNESTAIATKTTQYGQTFEQAIPTTGVNGKTIDITFVLMKDNTGTVRLVTGIPAKQ